MISDLLGLRKTTFCSIPDEVEGLGSSAIVAGILTMSAVPLTKEAILKWKFIRLGIGMVKAAEIAFSLNPFKVAHKFCLKPQVILRSREEGKMKKDTKSGSSIIQAVSSYISRSGELELPSEVITKAKHHILDGLTAMVSGSKLKPGQLVKNYVKNQSGVKEAQVAGSHIVTSAINAAFANGIMAHADETDDSHARS